MQLRTLPSLLIVLALSPACSKAGEAPVPPSDAAAEPHDPLGPPSQAEVPTTDGAIAVGNLSAQIDALGKVLATSPRDLDAKRQLVPLLATRAKFLGRIADTQRAVALSEDVVRDAPNDASAYVARSSMRAAMHRFADALADLAEAEKRGTRPADLSADRASILEAQGDLDGALALRRAAREARADVGTIGAEAALLGQLGKTDEADALLRRAAREYRGVSPFPIAWIFLQQGVIWERAGNTARARAFFAAALDRLPVYGHAASHLATLVPPARGVTLLQPIVAASDDPEFAMILAARMRSTGDVAGADALSSRAGARYAELCDKHPEAFAEHAGWFWLDEGKDARRALDLAKKNLAIRKTEKAYRLAILAAIAAGARDEACSLGKEAEQARRTSEMLRAVASDACKSVTVAPTHPTPEPPAQPVAPR